jgi:hypothetical protein
MWPEPPPIPLPGKKNLSGVLASLDFDSICALFEFLTVSNFRPLPNVDFVSCADGHEDERANQGG